LHGAALLASPFSTATFRASGFAAPHKMNFMGASIESQGDLVHCTKP